LFAAFGRIGRLSDGQRKTSSSVVLAEFAAGPSVVMMTLEPRYLAIAELVMLQYCVVLPDVSVPLPLAAPVTGSRLRCQTIQSAAMSMETGLPPTGAPEGSLGSYFVKPEPPCPGIQPL
jgi:hypothetical protein